MALRSSCNLLQQRVRDMRYAIWDMGHGIGHMGYVILDIKINRWDNWNVSGNRRSCMPHPADCISKITHNTFRFVCAISLAFACVDYFYIRPSVACIAKLLLANGPTGQHPLFGRESHNIAHSNAKCCGLFALKLPSHCAFWQSSWLVLGVWFPLRYPGDSWHMHPLPPRAKEAAWSMAVLWTGH